MKIRARSFIKTIILSLIFVFVSPGIAEYLGAESIAYAACPEITGKELHWENSSIAGKGTNFIEPFDYEANHIAAGNDNEKKTRPLSTLVVDLIIENITWLPENPTIGDTVTFSVTVKNQGTAKAGSSRVAYYIDEEYQTSDYISTLNPGAVVENSFTWIAQPGSHNIKAIADFNDDILESDETNNIKAFAFAPTAPDLIIQSITWSPVNPSEGDTVNFNILIKNQGNRMAAASHIDFHIDGSPRGEKDVNQLNAGATLTKTYTWVCQPGSHTIKAIVDSKHQLTESDETNNEKTVIFSPAIPDLAIQNITWSPENISKNDDVTFTVTIKNQGSGRADYFHIAYYIDDIYLTSNSVNPIDAGAADNQTLTWIAQSGSHTIKVVVDSNSWVTESDENNNEKTVNLSTLTSDLIIEDITWSPDNPSVGDTVTFTVTIRNQGGGRADNSRLAYYIADVYTGYIDVQEIEADAVVSETFTWKAEPGLRTIKVAADYNDSNLESDETNNAKAVTFTTLAPDLVIKDITWSPENPSIGTTVTYNVTIANQGSGRAHDSYVAYYIDSFYLTSEYIGPIEAGATDNRTFTTLAEANLYDLKAVADYKGDVFESDESNNEKEVTIYPIAPDLVIKNVIWRPENPSIGDSIAFIATIENQGNDAAAGSLIAYYIDGSFRGYHDIQKLDAGATVIDTFTWTVDADSHIIEMVADSNETVLESDETNNCRTITLPPPDLVIQDINWSPTHPAIDETTTFTVIINNKGSGKAVNCNLTFYIDDLPIGQQKVEEIGAGTTMESTFRWTAQPGSHEIKVVADETNQVIEDDETNNERMASLSTLTPDLVVEEVTWSPQDPAENDEVIFTITIKNQGSGRAGTSTVAFYIDDSLISEQEVQEIVAGSTVTETFTWSAQLGSHEVRIMADETNYMVEIDETNNEERISFSTAIPDLVIEDVTWSPQDPAENDEVIFTITIKNQGSGRAGTSTVAFYIDDSLISEQEVQEIVAGSTVTETFTWSAQLGIHFIKLVADCGQTLTESDETNNVKLRVASLIVTGGDAANTRGNLLSNPPDEKGGLGNLLYLVIIVSCVIIGWIIYGVIKFKSQ